MSVGISRAVTAFHRSDAFLDEHDHGAMLDWTLANRARFKPARIVGDKVDPEKRVCETLRGLGPLEAVLKRRFTELLPAILNDTRTKAFALDSIELELAAHGDGAHFAPHMDTFTSEARRRAREAGRIEHDRAISAVYYFYREPKGFSGGELRLHPFDSVGGQGGHMDVPPVQNSVVAFPSWVFHEVRPVSCPSGAFEDFRFAVNCWFCTDLDRGGAS